MEQHNVGQAHDYYPPNYAQNMNPNQVQAWDPVANLFKDIDAKTLALIKKNLINKVKNDATTRHKSKKSRPGTAKPKKKAVRPPTAKVKKAKELMSSSQRFSEDFYTKPKQ